MTLEFLNSSSDTLYEINKRGCKTCALFGHPPFLFHI